MFQSSDRRARVAIGLIAAAVACSACTGTRTGGRGASRATSRSAAIVPVPARALADAVPAAVARVTSTTTPSSPRGPTLVVILDAMVKTGLPGDGLSDVPPGFEPDARPLRGVLARQILAIADVLLAHGVSTFGTEASRGRLTRHKLRAAADGRPDLEALLSVPLAERRPAAEDVLRGGTFLGAATMLAALDRRARVVGLSSEETAKDWSDALAVLDGAAARSADPAERALALRPFVLSGLGTDEAIAAYDRERAALLYALERYGHAVQVRGAELAERALVLASRRGLKTVAIIAGGHYADAIVARATALGAGTVVVEPNGYSLVVRDYALWIADLRARLPPPVLAAPVPGGPDLPSLEPWISVLRPYAEPFRGAVPPPEPRPPADSGVVEVAGADPLAAALGRAADRLAGVVPVVATAALVLEDSHALLASVSVWRIPATELFIAAADGDHLVVTPAFATLPTDEMAVVLAHELVHVADVRAMSRALGVAPSLFRRALRDAPETVRSGLELLLQDRAYRVELDLGRALGLVHGLAGRPAVRPAGGARAAGAAAATGAAGMLRASLARLDELRGHPRLWIPAISSRSTRERPVTGAGPLVPPAFGAPVRKKAAPSLLGPDERLRLR